MLEIDFRLIYCSKHLKSFHRNLFLIYPKSLGSGSEWHSKKKTRSSNRHGASLWHSYKMIWCVTLAEQQNSTVRHFGTAIKCLSFNFFFYFYFMFLVKKQFFLALYSFNIQFLTPFYTKPDNVKFFIYQLYIFF